MISTTTTTTDIRTTTHTHTILARPPWPPLAADFLSQAFWTANLRTLRRLESSLYALSASSTALRPISVKTSFAPNFGPPGVPCVTTFGAPRLKRRAPYPVSLATPLGRLVVPLASLTQDCVGRVPPLCPTGRWQRRLRTCFHRSPLTLRRTPGYDQSVRPPSLPFGRYTWPSRRPRASRTSPTSEAWINGTRWRRRA